jgi:hypothetical protein
MSDGLYQQMEELLRETFEGGRAGSGTQYLDHDSGISNTIRRLTPEQASQRNGNHPSIAAHLRHMAFHMRVSYEWISGDHSKRDWKGSFLPQAVTDQEWSALVQELQRTREQFLKVMQGLPPDRFISEGAGMGAVAHLAYHLGAIRQLLPPRERETTWAGRTPALRGSSGRGDATIDRVRDVS